MATDIIYHCKKILCYLYPTVTVICVNLTIIHVVTNNNYYKIRIYAVHGYFCQ